MIDLESKFEVLEGEVKEINANTETLKKNLLDLIELNHILHKTHGFFNEVRHMLHWYLLAWVCVVESCLLLFTEVESHNLFRIAILVPDRK